jgi:hypothetical protein
VRRLRSIPAALGAALLLALALAVAVSAAAEEPTRAEYVAQLERICKPGSEGIQRAVHGVRADLRAERLAVAGRKFARAKVIFAKTERSISAVARPSADRSTLTRWFAAIGSEKAYLGQMVSALRADNFARFQRVFAGFSHEGNRANNAVVAFGFNYCAYKPGRYQ